MSPADRVSPGGARWCEEHRMFECTKQRTKGRGTCHQPAVRGTDTCRNHAGVTLAAARARGAAVEAITAWSALGGDPDVDPAMAVLRQLQLACLRADLYGSLLQAQVAAQGGDEVDVPGDLEDVQPAVGDGPQTGGLIGHTYAIHQATGKRVPIGEGARGLVVLEAAERDRVVRFAKTAHDMGISERQTQLAEAQGVLLARVIRSVLDRLDLTETQRGLVPRVVQEELEAVAIGGAA